MKKLLCLLLILSLLLPLCGCQEEQPSFKKPVNFYYPKVTPTYGTSDGLIAPVQAEGDGYQRDSVALLNRYFQGTQDHDYRNAFPMGAEVLSVEVVDGIAEVQVNKTFAILSGLNLTMACTCLTLTVLDLTDAEGVRISAKYANLDGLESIYMDRNCLSLLDEYVPETT